MKKIRIEDIVFWIVILLLIALAIWLIIGSPTDTASIIAIAIFISSSELLLWKTIFKFDKKTALGFEKVKSRFDNIDYKLKEINKKLK